MLEGCRIFNYYMYFILIAYVGQCLCEIDRYSMLGGGGALLNDNIYSYNFYF
jgi:hypothetical protein